MSSTLSHRVYPLFIQAIDALIVAIETQAVHLANKKSWTRRIVLLTDGENPIEIEDWEATVSKMQDLNIGFTVMYVPYCSGISQSHIWCDIEALILMTKSYRSSKKINLK